MYEQERVIMLERYPTQWERDQRKTNQVFAWWVVVLLGGGALIGWLS